MKGTPWSWWKRLLCQLDMLNEDGSPSFSKNMAVAVLIASIVTGDFGLGIATLLISASFGKSVFIAFLKRTQIFASASNTRAHVTNEIIERRDPDLGVEPAI